MKPHTGNVSILSALGFVPVARIRPRTAQEIGKSPWSIGSETLDRDYADFTQTGKHLGELGATQLRLQGGWAKCDPGTGQYNWGWLDQIVDSATAQGVRPWIETSYGNPAYPGGGGIGLAQGIPTSPEALAAWDAWVRALVTRYGDRVETWEIWNEPDIHNAMTPAEYTTFFVRTMAIIRDVQPESRSVGLALAGRLDFAEGFLSGLAAQGKGDLLNEVAFHFYPHNPDDQFEKAAKLAALVRAYTPHVTLRQGETGSPSHTTRFMAMGDYEWSERKQAAWNLRRLLAHHSRGYPMNLFQLADMQYRADQGAKFTGRNPKGQLAINEDLTVAYRKPSYFMAQHVFSIFDARFPMQELPNLAADDPVRTYAHAWTAEGDANPSLVAWWRAAEPPALEECELDRVALTAVRFAEPVLVDFLSGLVFELPTGGDAVWAELPRLDVPLAIAERSALPLRDLES